MPATIARPSTIPQSPEVVLACVRSVDATLVADVTDARRRLDQVAPEVIALLTEIRQLEARAFDAADAIAGQGYDGWRTGDVDRVVQVTGAHELMEQAEQLVGAYPLDA